MVLIRPPSLEPSTPEVREPRATARRLVVAASAGHRCEDGLHRRLVTEASGVEHEVVVAGQVPGVAVHLTDVGAPVLVRLLHPAPSLIRTDAVPIHDGDDPFALRGTEEDV